MQASAPAEVSEELLDEALAESFPASDPLSYWSGRDRTDPEEGEVPDPIPEADDPRIARAWEASSAMEGPAPTG